MQKKNLHISTTILIAFFLGFLLYNHIPSIAQEEQVQVPGINEGLIEKNKDVELLSPNYGDIFPLGEEILISWRNKNPQNDYIYVVYYYYLEGQFHMGYSGRSTEETNFLIQPFQESVIALQVYYYDKEFFYTEQKKEHMYATDILVLGIGMDIPEFWYKRFYKEKPLPIENPITEPTTIPQEKAKEKKQKIQEIVSPSVEQRSKKFVKKVIQNQEETFAWNLTEQREVKGSQVKKTECRYKYIQTYGSVRKIQCDIPSLENLTAQVIDRGAYKEILVRGDIYRDIFVDIDIYTCKNNILQLLLGKECKEKYLTTENLHIYPNIHMSILLNGKKYSPLSFGISQNNFFLTTQISKTENVESIDLEYITAFRISQFNILESKKEKYTISVEEVQERTKPFIFPFNQIVGVSQWHGYTDYQKPHTGIDFSVVKKDTLAVGDGLVVGKGWDSFYGKCLSGGNYLTVKHDNGMHSVYFHLEDSFTDVGKRVKEGDIVAKTGNSGYWNCQPLAYHLHFELRENAQQSSHVNPVEYIEQDWDKILTVGYKQYPGRLSGDNPHPGR
ncbi:MAG: M23 family metallopeptidase [Candidatus Dojkabacteria bacterium]|jgi:murein DD-endopeptidase MepM/ murein hydrolase activator NlpD